MQSAVQDSSLPFALIMLLLSSWLQVFMMIQWGSNTQESRVFWSGSRSHWNNDLYWYRKLFSWPFSSSVCFTDLRAASLWTVATQSRKQLLQLGLQGTLCYVRTGRISRASHPYLDKGLPVNMPSLSSPPFHSPPKSIWQWKKVTKDSFSLLLGGKLTWPTT